MAHAEKFHKRVLMINSRRTRNEPRGTEEAHPFKEEIVVKTKEGLLGQTSTYLTTAVLIRIK